MRFNPIAIVGAGCRLPGAADLESYWSLLSERRCAVGQVPLDRWDAAAYFDEDPTTPGKMNMIAGGFIDNPFAFDASFFGIAPREAESLDPQQRLLLEVSWQAFENACIVPETVAGKRGGVYVGMSSNDYGALYHREADKCTAYSLAGNLWSYAAGRLSRFYDLRGPSLTLDTACSSSLVATHYACQALALGEIDIAVVGGVNLILEPSPCVSISKLWMMSPTGRCHSFDAKADGYVRSEGCVVVVLKRLDEAIRDKDPILATLRGTTVQHDGRRGTLTSPDTTAQEEILRTCLDSAGMEPDDIGYVEAHGIATPMTDVMELDALHRVFSGRTRKLGPVIVSTVKPNLGHVEPAAGVTSMLKAALSLHNRQVTPVLGFEALNPKAVPSEAYQICTATYSWPADGRVAAGVNTFGLSGTNAYAILRGPP